jgi:hypothetical protein
MYSSVGRTDSERAAGVKRENNQSDGPLDDIINCRAPFRLSREGRIKPSRSEPDGLSPFDDVVETD